MIIAPSILSANFANLEKSIERVKDAKWLHVDVMDGHFVPNITLGPMIVKALKSLTNQVLDTHLMITHPEQYYKQYIEAGSDYITFHIETVDDPITLIQNIKSLGAKAGISIKPTTPVTAIKELLLHLDQVLVMSVEPGFGGQSFMPSALDKIGELKALKEKYSYTYLISVDGGINQDTSKLCKEKGVDVLVAGSYIFNSPNAQERIDSLR